MGRFTRTTKPYSYTKRWSTFRTVLTRAATRAGLGGVRFIHFDIVATCVRAFIIQLPLNFKPTCVIDGFGKFALVNDVDFILPTTIRLLALTSFDVNLWMRSWRVFLILAWMALTRFLFLALWAMASFSAYWWVILVCSLSPSLLTAESLQPKSIPTWPVPHAVFGNSLTVTQTYQLPRLSCTNSQVLMV